MMEPLSLKRIAEYVGGAVSGPAGGTVRRVVTDSRQVRPGDLFVALHGPRFDGHAFLGRAFDRGAVAALGEVDRLAAECPHRSVVQVSDSREALGRLAAAYRRGFSLPIVAVAGSNGKTTTKELLATVLGRRFSTLASEASFNNDIGVPLTLLGIEPQHRAAVVEVGTNHPGELAPLLDLIRPGIGVLTSLGREHLEFFDDLDGVVAEESQLAAAIPPHGRLFVNADAPLLDTFLSRAKAPVARVGWGLSADWRILAARVDLGGSAFRLEGPRAEFDGEYFSPLIGVHQVVTAALAVAVGAELGLTQEQIREGLARGRPASMRLETHEFGSITVLDDCYNANLDSVIAALSTLRDVRGDRRSVAILGGMAELGRASDREHDEAGTAAALCDTDLLVTVGPWRGRMAASARAAGLAEVVECADLEEVRARADELLETKDVVLVKASRAWGFERLVQGLRDQFELQPERSSP